MPILDSHWTDAEIAGFAQTNMDELVQILGLKDRIQVVASTFFLNSNLLGCTPDSMKEGVRRKLIEILPPHITLPTGAEHTFMELGDLAYKDAGKITVVLSRPDNASTLAERITHRTGIKADDLAVDAAVPSCGFDNLELMERVYEIFNSLPNGGVNRLKAVGNFNIIQYRSMLGARRQFLLRGGNTKTIGLHEAASHIGAFTKAKIPYEYVGFMADLGLSEIAVEYAYRDIFTRLVKLGHTTKITRRDKSEYQPLSIDNLLLAMSDLLNEYVNKITTAQGKSFSAFYSTISVGNATVEEQKIVSKLTPEDILQNTAHLIVFQTVKGLKFLMGEHALRYAPQKSNGSFDRVNNLLNLRYS